MPNALTAGSEGTEGNKRATASISRIFRSRIGRAVFLSFACFPAVAVTGLLSAEMPVREMSDVPAMVSASSAPVAERVAEAYRFVPDGPKETRLSREKGRIVPEPADSAFADGVREIVRGYPIETMVPTIATYDREIAGLIVGIAKKESDWGRHAPSDGAGDCFNYWGYKGFGSRGTAMGYACFGSPEEAVRTVGNRISGLVEKKKTSDPERLIVWKCGSSCAGHSPESVSKWISDVRTYYDRIVNS